jgi:hypothetical protein
MAPRNSLLHGFIVLALGFVSSSCTSTSDPWPPAGADYRGPSDLDADDEDVWRRLDAAENTDVKDTDASRTAVSERPSPPPDEPWSLTADLERSAVEPSPPATDAEPIEEPATTPTVPDPWTQLLEEAESGDARSPKDVSSPEGGAEKSTTPPESTGPSPEGSPPSSVDDAEGPLSITSIFGPGETKGPTATSESSDPTEATSLSAPDETELPTEEPAEPPEGTKLSTEEIQERVGELVAQLGAEEAEAKRAFRDLWEIPREWIPRLLVEVESDRPTLLTEISVLVLDTKRFVRLDEVTGKLAYTIPGMGRFEYDDVAAGRIWQGRAIKAVFRNLDGFPLGVVVRAALVNRFRSTDYPSGDDRRDPVRWWQRFYERVNSKP